MVAYFPEKWFTAVHGDIVTIVLFITLNVLSVSFNVLSLFISRASRNFLLLKFAITDGDCSRVNPVDLSMAVFAPDNSQLPFFLSW